MALNENLMREVLSQLLTEHDIVLKEYQKQRERLFNCKRAIGGISGLLGVPVDEDYGWDKRIVETTRRK